ncbi:unnamed protein product [Bemisia tabaci]|uniref:Uncharacterized protein n=1 Tax=Bemisia tabaci TaxID=7038 RepID=A0A9P0A2A4_BEMTA|nr:unnamed protein product [Bemisia tabaci]
MPLSWSSRDCIFVNTSHPDKRVAVTKSKRELKDLSDDSTDIFTTTVLDHYIQRPDELEALCLAKFASLYNYRKNRPPRNSKSINEDGSGDEWDFEIEEGIVNNVWLPLKNNCGFIRKREIGKVIRYVRFNKECHEDDYYRENLMLYLPWRDENTD